MFAEHESDHPAQSASTAPTKSGVLLLRSDFAIQLLTKIRHCTESSKSLSLLSGRMQSCRSIAQQSQEHVCTCPSGPDPSERSWSPSAWPQACLALAPGLLKLRLGLTLCVSAVGQSLQINVAHEMPVVGSKQKANFRHSYEWQPSYVRFSSLREESSSCSSAASCQLPAAVSCGRHIRAGVLVVRACLLHHVASLHVAL